jgi:hypothetical protein
VLVGKPVANHRRLAGRRRHGAGMQQQLKLVLMSTLALVMPHSGVVVGQAGEKIRCVGALIHEPTRLVPAKFLADFEQWIERLK